MSLLKWKRFNFFNLVLHDDLSKLYPRSEFVSQCYNAHYKVFCDNSGLVYMYSKNWEVITFQTNMRNIKCCALTEEKSLLVLVSQRSHKDDLWVQVFNLAKITRRNGAPSLGAAQLITNSLAMTVRACILDNMTVIAIGLERGDILLHRAIINRDMSPYFQHLSICDAPIVGIELIQTKSIHMFVCTKKSVSFYVIGENNNINETKVILDVYTDAKVYCSSRLGYKDLYFLVGRYDAIYCFTNDGRGPCYAIEGIKKHIAWFANNLIVVIESEKNTFSTNPTFLLIIIDIHSKIIVLRKKISPIVDIFVDGKHCYLLTNTNQLYVLRDRDFQNKIRLLSKRNLFDVALHILADQNDRYNMTALMLQYGDYLYQRGDISGATEKYINTAGLTEHYCIIQKLLDPKYNNYLTHYLENLVNSNNATETEEELLLNCKRRSCLSSKVDRICSNNNIFSMCYSDYSSRYDIFKLIQKAQNDSEACNIDKQELFEKYDQKLIYDLLMENSYILMSYHSQEVTKMLITYCFNPTQSTIVIFEYPEHFISLLANKRENCVEFLEHLTAKKICNAKTCTYLLRMYLSNWQKSEESTHDILKFIKEHKHILMEQSIILCRNYTFWPGIVYYFENCKLERLGLRHYIKCNDFDIKNKNFNYKSSQSKMLLQSFGKLMSASRTSVNALNNLIDVILKVGHQPAMQILRSISLIDTVTILHIKSFFLQGCTILDAQKYLTLVNSLKSKLKKLEMYLQNLKMNPIEFRNNVCDLCRQKLKFPAVYFPCQHSFHKDCLSPSLDKNTCISCSESKKDKPLNRVKISSEDSLQSTLISDAVNYISQTLYFGSLEWNDKKFRKSQLTDQSQSTNPFEEQYVERKKPQNKEYDCNLNPFM